MTFGLSKVILTLNAYSRLMASVYVKILMYSLLYIHSICILHCLNIGDRTPPCFTQLDNYTTSL